MNITNKSLVSLVLVLSVGASGAFAQSCAATTHLSNAVGHSVAASGEAVGASMESAAASVKIASGIVAVPVMMSGAIASGGGAVLNATADAAAKGRKKLWDFASGDPSQRPALDRTHAVPPVAVHPDPTPAEALNGK